MQKDLFTFEEGKKLVQIIPKVVIKTKSAKLPLHIWGRQKAFQRIPKVVISSKSAKRPLHIWGRQKRGDVAEGGAGGKHFPMCSPGIDIFLNLYIFFDRIFTYLLVEFMDICRSKWNMKSKALRISFECAMCDEIWSYKKLWVGWWSILRYWKGNQIWSYKKLKVGWWSTLEGKPRWSMDCQNSCKETIESRWTNKLESLKAMLFWNYNIMM